MLLLNVRFEILFTAKLASDIANRPAFPVRSIDGCVTPYQKLRYRGSKVVLAADRVIQMCIRDRSLSVSGLKGTAGSMA